MRGIVTVLNTPFTVSDAIDIEGLRNNVSNAIEAGVAGFLVPAMASEVSELTGAEKREIVKQVVAQVDSRVTVIGGAAADTQQDRLKLARELIDLGCDGILIPVEPKADPILTERQLIEIADLEPKFLMLQDWDSAGPGMSIETIVRLFHRIDQFKWLKIEVQNAGPKYTRVLDETQGDLGIAGGWAVTQMIDGLDRGVDVFMPTAMHSVYVEIYQRYATGDHAGAIELFNTIEPVLAFSNQQLDISIRFFKQMLFAQGVYATPNVRIAGAPLNPDQQQIADELIRIVNTLQTELAN